MKWLTIIILCTQSLVIFGQEPEIPLYLQKPLEISNPDFNKIIDSLARINLQPNFIKELIKPNSDFNKIIESENKSEENRRLQHLFGNYADFKKEFLDLKLKDEPVSLYLKQLREELLSQRYANNNGGGVVFSGPISSIYNAFSKEVQSQEKYNKIIAYEPSQHIINTKYNFEKVQQWTGLKENELTKFVLFCNFKDSFILYASDYELIDSVRHKLIEFMIKTDSCNYQN